MNWGVLAYTVLGCLVAGYAVTAAWAAWRPPAAPAANHDPQGTGLRPVSVLKPLCGADPRLYENLAGLCRQQHSAFQLVFGVRAADDAAIAVVERLRADFPDCDIVLVIDPRVHGSNLKVSNLINLLPQARHAWLVVADSDIAVQLDYLARVTAPLSDAAVGVVTCLYRGRPAGGLWSLLGAQFINDWFAPSVRVAHGFGSSRFSFGATIALRRDVLDAIGGFSALSNRLADDFWLGELTRHQGLRTVLSDVIVLTDVTETRLAALWAHEIRWLRTIRSLNPAGFAFTFITFTWPMLALACWLAPAPIVLGVSLAGVLARCMLAGGAGAALRAPLRDTLLLAGWATAMFGQHVRWHDQVLSVHDRTSPAETRPTASPATQPGAEPPPVTSTHAQPGIAAGFAGLPRSMQTEGMQNTDLAHSSPLSANGMIP